MAEAEAEAEYEFVSDDGQEDEEEVHVMPDGDGDGDGEEEGGGERSVSGQTTASAAERREVTKRAASYREKDDRCKPVFQSGNLKITAAQARLYGLLDENGKFKELAPEEIQIDAVAENLRKLSAMSAPREIDLSHVEDLEAKEETFRPARSDEARKAMLNPRCGYDFIDRLEQQGDFLQRMQGNDKTQSRMAKLLRDEAKTDYEATKDKLACPQCKKTQTFDEFWEKKRMCSACKVRYEKTNLCNAAAFEARLRAAEERRVAKLAAAEDEVYGRKDKAASASAAGSGKLALAGAAADAVSSSALPHRLLLDVSASALETLRRALSAASAPQQRSADTSTASIA